MTPRLSEAGETTTDERTEHHDAMTHPHRRWVVDALETCGDLDLTGVAAHVLRREGESGEDARRNVEIGLVHVHLPKLDETDFVDFDAEERAVSLGERIEASDSRFESATAALSD